MMQRAGHSFSIDSLELPSRPGSTALEDAGGALLLGVNLSVRFNRPGRPGGGGQRADRALAAELDAILKALEQDSERSRSWALGEIERLGDKAVVAVPKLITLLEDRELELAFQVADTLGVLGPAAREAAPALVRVARGNDTDLRQSALEALGRLQVAETLSVLAEAVKDKNWKVRESAVIGLAGFGMDGLPWLIEGLGGNACAPALRAAEVIQQLGAAAAPQLIQALEHPDKGVRTMSIALIGEIQPRQTQAVPEILPHLRDEHILVRYAAVETLGKLGSRDALEPIRDLLKSEVNWWVQREAFFALKELERNAG